MFPAKYKGLSKGLVNVVILQCRHFLNIFIYLFTLVIVLMFSENFMEYREYQTITHTTSTTLMTTVFCTDFNIICYFL